MANRRQSPGRRTAPKPAAGAATRTLAPAIVKGNEALTRNEWELSKASFEEALRLEETPEALEGLGMAAWWLDDVALVFDGRERAYRLYRQRDDRRGAGRVAMMLAEDYFHFRGEPAVARGWFQRARRLLGGLDLVPEHGWLKLWESHLTLMLGEDPAVARGLAVEAVDTGRELADVDLEMTALALEGMALVLQGDVSAGMPRLDEATTAVVSGEMTDPMAIGLSCCLLVAACESTRDFERAAQWCHRMKEFCERTRSHFLLAICRTDYARVLAWRGAWGEAEAELQAAIRQHSATRPPLQQDPLALLADLRRLQGRLDEAAEILKRIDGSPLALLGRAALAVDRSDAAAAAQAAQRFLRQIPASNRTDRVAALDVLLRAQVRLGRRREARATLEKLEAVTRLVATEPMTASALVAAGLVASAEGDLASARGAFEDAITLFARSGAAYELARARVELARVLGAQGERHAAAEELEAAWLTFEAIGAGPDLARATALRAALAPAPEARPVLAPAGLTRREVEVLRLVAQGMSNQKIAQRLFVSEFTVKRHVANLLSKLSLPSRAAAAAHAARHGIA
jgi:LuxR family maltose regulon positive regulatory protein